MFYNGLKGLYKTFCGTAKKCENKKLILIFIEMRGVGRVKKI